MMVVLKEAVIEKAKHKTIKPHNLKKRVTVQYQPRKSDGAVLWAQIGIYENMLYWKTGMTYQFLVPFDSEKKLMQAYKEKLAEIELRDQTEEVRALNRFSYVEEEHEMETLYWSKSGKCYASARYTERNR